MEEHPVTEERDIVAAAASPSTDQRCDPVIEPNGSEYLVTINGSVFLALSLSQAETIAYRMRGKPALREQRSGVLTP